MDYYQNQNNEMNQNIPQIDPKYRGLSIASMVCGICSLVLCCTGLLSIPTGALGILFVIAHPENEGRTHEQYVCCRDLAVLCGTGTWYLHHDQQHCHGIHRSFLYEYAGSDVPADVRCRYGRILAILPVRHAYVFRCILQLRNQNPEQPE